jgi:hypothetical protein
MRDLRLGTPHSNRSNRAYPNSIETTRAARGCLESPCPREHHETERRRDSSYARLESGEVSMQGHRGT